MTVTLTQTQIAIQNIEAKRNKLGDDKAERVADLRSEIARLEDLVYVIEHEPDPEMDEELEEMMAEVRAYEKAMAAR